MSSKKPSLVKLLSETSRIITTHPRQFLTLSALFLFPISFLTALYPFLYHPTPLPALFSNVTTPYPEIPPAPKSHLQIQIIYTLLLFFFSSCAIASITRTAINALQNHPVQLAPSLKSIPLSFLPILGTKLATVFIMGLISFAYALIIGLIFLAFNMDYTSIYFIVSFFLISALLYGVMVYIGLQWVLAYPIVVLEATWGFAPLKRSSYLVKGMRRVVLLMMMTFGIPSLVMWMWYAHLTANSAGGCTGWVTVEMLVYACFVTILPLFNIVANTVLLVYCKELHDELPVYSQIDMKAGGEYVKVPLDH